MPYTDAALMESQRLSHVVPIIGPRRVLADTTLGGYDIAKVGRTHYAFPFEKRKKYAFILVNGHSLTGSPCFVSGQHIR